MEKRVRKKSKRLSESSSIFDEDELPRKRSKRTKSAAVSEDPSPTVKKTARSSQRNSNSKKMIVKVDFTNNDNLKLGGVLLSQLGPTSSRGKGQRTRRSVSLASSHSNSIPEEAVKPEKMNFKNPKFCFSYLAGNKKKPWKNFKQIMTAERALPWSEDTPRFSSLEAPPLLRPARKYSDISGLLAKYTDPLTGLYYSSSAEYQLIRTLTPDIVQAYLALRGKMTIS